MQSNRKHSFLCENLYVVYVKTSMLSIPIYLPVGRQEMRDKLCFKKN